MKIKNIDCNLLKLSKIQLIAKINSLELINEDLESTIKDELYKIFMDKLKEPQELQRLKKENKNLRSKVKTLKQVLKGDNT
jgi:DNA anti-recombination protein RmuC